MTAKPLFLIIQGMSFLNKKYNHRMINLFVYVGFFFVLNEAMHSDHLSNACSNSEISSIITEENILS